MNFTGRILGGVLIAIATAWILGIAGVFPFNSRTNNQLQTTADRTPVSNANAQRPIAQTNPSGSQSYGSGNQQSAQTGAQPSDTLSAQTNTTNQPTTSTDGSGTGSTTFSNTTPTDGTSASQTTTPALRAAW